MAQLLKISTRRTNPYNEVGDIIGVFEDSHIFSENERNKFDIEKIKGTREEVEKNMRDMLPNIKFDSPIGVVEIWSGDKWQEINEPKYKWNRTASVTREKLTENIKAVAIG